ncbi:hypothetical protein Tco_0115990 [Tanacetum coccineum]
MLFDNAIKWVDLFVPMDTKVVEGSKSQAEGSKKRTREELAYDNSKKQKINDNVEAEVDDEAEMKKLMEIVLDDEVVIDAIPLATKSPIIADWKIIKEGKMGYFQIIRADGSSRRYSSMIKMLQNINSDLGCMISDRDALTATRSNYQRQGMCRRLLNAVEQRDQERVWTSHIQSVKDTADEKAQNAKD